MVPVSVEERQKLLFHCWWTLHWPSLIPPIYFSLSFYPAQMCHLSKTLQSVWLIGSVVLRNEILWAAGWWGLFNREVSHSWRTKLLKNQPSKPTFFYHEYAGNLPVLWSCGTKSLGLSSGKNDLLFVCMIWWDFSLIYIKKRVGSKEGVHSRTIYWFLVDSKERTKD